MTVATLPATLLTFSLRVSILEGQEFESMLYSNVLVVAARIFRRVGGVQKLLIPDVNHNGVQMGTDIFNDPENEVTKLDNWRGLPIALSLPVYGGGDLDSAKVCAAHPVECTQKFRLVHLPATGHDETLCSQGDGKGGLHRLVSWPREAHGLCMGSKWTRVLVSSSRFPLR